MNIYDFDKTLSTRDMQDFALIPSLNMESAAFWQAANDFGSQQKMDSILAYMYTAIREAKNNGVKYSIVGNGSNVIFSDNGFDGLVMIPNCDKNVPGLLMAAARLNIPTIFVSGGPMLAGRVGGKKTSLSSMFEAVGAYKAGKIDEEKTP